MKIYHAIFLLATLLVGCRLESSVDQPNTSTESIRFDIGVTTTDDSTKGAMVSRCEEMGSMAIYCAYTQDESWSTSTKFEKFNNTRFDYDSLNVEWIYAGGTPQWDATAATDKYTFLAYSPYASESNNIEPTIESGALKVTYTVPAEYSDQPDLMLALPCKDISPQDGDCVSLNFKHALAAIGFGVKGVASDVVQSIALKNIVPSGSVQINDKDEIVWSDPAQRTSIEYSAGIKSDIEPDIYTSMGLTLDSGYLMMIPQEIRDVDVVVTIFNTESNESRSETFSFGYDDEWEAGQSYQYTVNLSSHDYTIEGTASCYMLHPNGAEQIFYIPVEGRVNTFWRDYVGHTDKLSSSDAWTASVLWYDIDDGTIDNLKVERVTSGFTPNTTVTPQCAPDFTTIGTRSAMKITLPADITAGNILIAVEYSTELLWSWHLWITEYDPDSIVASSKAQSGRIAYSVNGVDGEVHRYDDSGVWGDIYDDKFIMDRNLGARDTGYNSDKAGVLHYQFGRKDPFPVSCSSSTTIDNSRVSFGTAVRNPTTFYTQQNSPYSWSNEGLIYGGSYLWDDDSVANDGSASAKTFFDPSPLGWQIPQHGTYEVLSNRNCRYYNNRNLIIYNSAVNFPLTGYRSNYSGDINDYGDQGNLRLSTPIDESYAYNLVYESNIESETNNTRADGFCIRCIEE